MGSNNFTFQIKADNPAATGKVLTALHIQKTSRKGSQLTVAHSLGDFLSQSVHQLIETTVFASQLLWSTELWEMPLLHRHTGKGISRKPVRTQSRHITEHLPSHRWSWKNPLASFPRVTFKSSSPLPSLKWPKVPQCSSHSRSNASLLNCFKKQRFNSGNYTAMEHNYIWFFSFKDGPHKG